MVCITPLPVVVHEPYHAHAAANRDQKIQVLLSAYAQLHTRIIAVYCQGD